MDFYPLFFVFTLTAFLGFELLSKVPSRLHTPLMSGTNAVSGIILLGAIALATRTNGWALFLNVIAIFLATVNVIGGYSVTHRMLAMFTKKPR